MDRDACRDGLLCYKYDVTDGELDVPGSFLQWHPNLRIRKTPRAVSGQVSVSSTRPTRFHTWPSRERLSALETRLLLRGCLDHHLNDLIRVLFSLLNGLELAPT